MHSHRRTPGIRADLDYEGSVRVGRCRARHLIRKFSVVLFSAISENPHLLPAATSNDDMDSRRG